MQGGPPNGPGRYEQQEQAGETDPESIGDRSGTRGAERGHPFWDEQARTLQPFSDLMTTSHGLSADRSRLVDYTVALGTSDAKRRLIFGAFLIGLAANIGVALSLRNNFPFEDSVNHLTRWVLMADAWTGHGAPYIRLHAIPGPYLGLDLVGAALATVLSPTMTLRMMSVLVVTAIPAGFYLLLRAVNRENTAWSLVGVLV